MTRMQLVTFLLNDVVDSVSRTTRLARYGDTSKGSDYYWAAKRAAARMFLGGESFDEAISSVMSNMTVPHQRRDNQDALKELYNWKFNNPGNAVPPPSGEIAGPKGELVIKLEPTFAIEQNGKCTAFVPWLVKDVRLDARVASIGVHLLQLGLQHGSYEKWRFCLIDVATGEKFGRVHKNTPEAARFSLRTQEELLIECKIKKGAA